MTKVEDMHGGTIRVYVQQHLTEDEAKHIGRLVFTLGALHDTDLKTVVVRDTSGVDTNVYRFSIPALDQ